ncbi:MAG: hypothetical protein F6K32_19225 [Desertifilum sp. SIO1I2]|nr:hypothetical protein [Desertifilum sp. SIO1I2]
MILDEATKIAIIQAIEGIRKQVTWKPQKSIPHLQKRINLGHLPQEATLAQYNAIITAIVTSRDAKVYIYMHETIIYPTLVAIIENKVWLVMIGLDGVLETAFPPDNPERYLSQPQFFYWGSVQELKI